MVGLSGRSTARELVSSRRTGREQRMNWWAAWHCCAAFFLTGSRRQRRVLDCWECNRTGMNIGESSVKQERVMDGTDDSLPQMTLSQLRAQRIRTIE